MHIQFQGAAQTVTGSMHVVQVGSKKILLDCGLVQGKRDEARLANSTFPFDIASIDAIVLSHAHIDHSGNLPGIVKQGYTGPIFSTAATRDLCSIMLADSAMLQDMDVKHLRKHYRDVPDPLYTIDDVARTMSRFHTVPYHQEFSVVEGISCKFYDAGHILGSAVCYLTLTENGRKVVLGFTGDLGRHHQPIIRDPENIPAVDYLISESTYGDRIHAEHEDTLVKLARVITEVQQRGGRLIVPAFSVGRTQDLLYMLHELTHTKKIKPIPVYVDSPLAINATVIYRMHTECFDSETRALILQDPFALGFDDVKYTPSVDESKALNDVVGSCMIIAASGMCEGGRILHHLVHGIGDTKNTVMIVGFQAPFTLGRRIVEHVPVVRIYGEEYTVRAKVETLNGMSAHADQAEIIQFITALEAQPKQIFLVHGDEDRQKPLMEVLQTKGYAQVSAPTKGMIVEL